MKEGVVGPEIKAASASFVVLDTLKANYFNGYKVSKIDTISFQFIKEIYKPDSNSNGIPIIENGKPKRVLASSTTLKRNTYFKVRFSEEVSWNLTLTKLLNGKRDNSVQKIISGTSSYLDSSNASWAGNANSTLFTEKDNVIVELSFVNGSSLVLRDTLYISKGVAYLKSEADLLIDFESGLVSAYNYLDDKDLTKTPIAPYIDIDNSLAIQGEYSFKLYGRDYNGDYFCGGLNIQQLDTETMKNYSPNDIYLNMYIYGYPANNSLEISAKATKLNIGFSEKDNPLNLEKDFDPLTEDTFEKEISVNWVGWKLVSVRYADLIPSTSKTNGGSGNKRFEPGKVFSANCNLISSPNNSTVGANIDYVIITYGQPFDANNL